MGFVCSLLVFWFFKSGILVNGGDGCHGVWLRAWCLKMKDFAQQREVRVARLTLKLYEGLVKPDGGEYLARTGSFLKSTTLRSKATRAAFAKILEASKDEESIGETLRVNDTPQQAKNRFWTERVVSDSVKALMKEYDLQVPQMPGFHLPSWIKRQTALLHGLARKAHRNSKAAPAMDGDQTLEYPAEDCAPSMHQCTYTAYTQHTYITYCFPKHSLTYLLPCLLTYTYMSHTCTHLHFSLSHLLEPSRTDPIWIKTFCESELRNLKSAQHFFRQEVAAQYEAPAEIPPSEPWMHRSVHLFP